MPDIRDVKTQTVPYEAFCDFVHKDSSNVKGLLPWLRDNDLGETAWICIAYNVRHESESWAKVGAAMLECLDPFLTCYKNKIESIIRMTFCELENLRLARWRLGEDLLDAEIPISIELQELLLAEPSELARQVAEVFERINDPEQRDRSIYFLREHPLLKPLKVILPKSTFSVSEKADMGLHINYKTDTTDVLEKLNDLSADQIWVQFHKNRDEYSRNLLMEHYITLVRYCAERLHSKLPDKVELDDLISAGIFGLMDAIDKFDPSIGVKFETYCSPRIRGSILDELRSMDWVPRLVRARSHQLGKATHTLETHFGRKPTEKEIAEELDMDMEEFIRLQRDANAASLVSLSTNYTDGDSEKDIREIDIIKDKPSKHPLIEAQKRDLNNLLTKGLTRAERLIVVLYYYEEMTMKEIGTTLDLSESRVSQMHSSIIARLKAQMNTRKKEFADSREIIEIKEIKPKRAGSGSFNLNECHKR